MKKNIESHDDAPSWEKIRKEISNKIVEERVAHGYSVSNLIAKLQLADGVDISPTQYKRYESGDAVISLKILCALCHVYGVSPNYLLNINENPDLSEGLNGILKDFDKATKNLENIKYRLKSLFKNK